MPKRSASTRSTLVVLLFFGMLILSRVMTGPQGRSAQSGPFGDSGQVGAMSLPMYAYIAGRLASPPYPAFLLYYGAAMLARENAFDITSEPVVAPR